MLYNSIVHKLFSGAPIQMKVFDDHIELWNEGELPVGYTILTEKQKKIYHLIAASADITAKQMAVILGIPLRTIEREPASMQRNGTIRHEGKARTGHWVILK